MGLGVALRAFFAALSDSKKSAAIVEALEGGESEAPSLPAPVEAKPPERNDAINLLAALQREARFLDLVMESLDGFDDAQIGSASRDVLTKSRKVLDRMFLVEPLREEEEGSSITVPGDFDPNAFQLVGNVTGEPPYDGKLTHAGWRASMCELPSWSGSEGATLTIAAAEVEI